MHLEKDTCHSPNHQRNNETTSYDEELRNTDNLKKTPNLVHFQNIGFELRMGHSERQAET